MKTANLNGTSVSYKYNSNGLRNYKKRGSTQFRYRYDASEALESIKRVKASGSSYTVYEDNDALNAEGKSMKDYENDCYKFILNLVKELAQDYDVQYQHMEEFARWNLPEETALEWIDAEGMVDVLERGKCIPKEIVDALRKIMNAFVLEFEKTDNPVWTQEAMGKSAFWNMQRLNARRVLDKMEA